VDTSDFLNNPLASSLFEASILAQCLLRESGEILLANRAFCELSGYASQELNGLYLEQIIQAESASNLSEDLKPFQSEVLEVRQCHCKDGTRKWVETQISVFPALTGTLLAQVRDIHHQKETEAHRNKLEGQLKRGFSMMLCGIGLVSLEGQFQHVNPALCELLQYPEPELLQQSVLDLAHPDDQATCFAVHEKLLQGQSYQGEKRYVRKDGKTVWVYTSVYPVWNEQGNIAYFASQFLDISSYKMLEHNLRVEQENLRLAFNNAAIGMALVSPHEGRYIKVNPRLCEMVGYTSEELMTKQVIEITHPEDRPRDHSLIRQLSAGEAQRIDIEKRYLHKDGHVVWVNVFSTCAYDTDNQLMYFVSQTLDITQRKRMEHALKASEEKFKTAFENAAFGIMVVTTTGIILEANRQLRDMLGYTIEEFRDLNYATLTHPDDLALDRAAYERMITHEVSTCSLEKRFIHKSGKVVWASLAGSSMLDEQGNLISFVAQISDLTEQKQVEQAYQQSEQKFRSAFQNAAIGMAIASPAGRWLQVNPALCDILGYSEAELLSIDFQSVTHRADQEKGQFYLDLMATRTLETFQIEKRYIHKKGSIIWVQLNVSAVYDEQGQLMHQIAQIQDISERLLAENKLLKAKEQAETAAQAKADFLSTMSHEIRTPLNAVLGMSYLLEETPLNADQRELLDTIQTGGKTLLSVINDILDFSKLESGKLEVDWHPVNIYNCVNEVLSLFRQKAEEKNLLLTSQIFPDVPVSIGSDYNRLRQILINLVGNAVKFTNQGSISITVKRGPAQDSDAENQLIELLFEIQDSGCGIPTDKLGSIFEAFTQADASTTRQFGGTGLGLSISRKLAHMLGGAIEVESTPGQGSLFRFRFKCQPAHNLMIPPSLQNTLNDGNQANSAFRILVVEDNLINRTLMAQILSKLGYQAELVSNGPDALDILCCQSFDLILMDIQMPGMDGIETTRQIRQNFSSPPPIIAVTAYALPEDRERFLMSGLDDCLEKPISPASVSKLLQKWQTEKEIKGAIIDTANLIQRFSTDQQILCQMAELFRCDGDRILTRIEKNLTEGNRALALECLHELKGTCLTLAANRMLTVVCKLEALCKQEDSVEYTPLIQTLRQEFVSVVDALDTLVDSTEKPIEN
jgi:PAS domain S-box-containing protein